MKQKAIAQAGLYVHVPFCERLCPYCDFYSKIAAPGEIDRYIEALGAEARLQADSVFGDFAYDSVFFGGGTPSILTDTQVGRLYDHLTASFNITPQSEITIECNPCTLNKSKLRAYARLGINRISLGIQSFSDRHLRKLGRVHDSKAAVESFLLARDAGFDNISIDLIYGLPGQTLAEWELDLGRAVDLQPAHISAYNLIIEPETPFGELYARGRLRLPSEKMQSRMYDLLNGILEEAGYRRYEISNFAKQGLECRHNLKYWHLDPYLGLGPAAVSFDGATRTRNINDLGQYLQAAQDDKLPPADSEVIDSNKLREETIMMGLRLADGLNLADLKDRFAYDLLADKGDIIESLVKTDCIAVRDGYLKLTQKSLFVSDEIIVKLI